jgi:hypothetical protein
MLAITGLAGGCEPGTFDPPTDPLSIVIVSGDGQPGAAGHVLAHPLVVEVREGERPLAGVPVGWATEFGVLNPKSATTDAFGQARAEWRLGDVVGEQQAFAHISGQPAVGFAATGEIPPDAIVEIAAPGSDRATVGGLFPEPLRATVQVEPGRPLLGASVTWDTGTGGGWVFPHAATTDANGVVSASWIAGIADSQSIVASSGPVSSSRTILAEQNRTRANSIYLDSSAPAEAMGFRAEFTPLFDHPRTFYAVLIWDGAYAGLQRGGDLFDRQVHFSVWNADGVDAIVMDSATSVCHPFGGEGTGQKCRLEFPWEIGRPYQFEMVAELGESHADYAVTFRDLESGVSIPVATLRFGARPNLGWITAFVEDFGPQAASCLTTAPRGGIIARREVRVDDVWQRVATARFQAVDNLSHCANVLAHVQDGGIFFGTGGDLVGDPAAVGATVEFPN